MAENLIVSVGYITVIKSLRARPDSKRYVVFIVLHAIVAIAAKFKMFKNSRVLEVVGER